MVDGTRSADLACLIKMLNQMRRELLDLPLQFSKKYSPERLVSVAGDHRQSFRPCQEKAVVLRAYIALHN